MDAQRPTTCRTHPPLPLAGNKLPDTRSLDHQQIVDHAHAVVGSVTIVHMPERLTGELTALEAVVDVPADSPLAGLDLALDAGFRLSRVVCSTTGTGVPFPHMGSTDAAIDAAGSDQRGVCQSRGRHLQPSNLIYCDTNFF